MCVYVESESEGAEVWMGQKYEQRRNAQKLYQWSERTIKILVRYNRIVLP